MKKKRSLLRKNPKTFFAWGAIRGVRSDKIRLILGTKLQKYVTIFLFKNNFTYLYMVFLNLTYPNFLPSPNWRDNSNNISYKKFACLLMWRRVKNTGTVLWSIIYAISTTSVFFLHIFLKNCKFLYQL